MISKIVTIFYFYFSTENANKQFLKTSPFPLQPHCKDCGSYLDPDIKERKSLCYKCTPQWQSLPDFYPENSSDEDETQDVDSSEVYDFVKELAFNERQLDEAYAEEDSQLQLFDEPALEDSQEFEDSEDEESQSILS